MTFDDDDELGRTAAATEYAVTDERVSLPAMFFRGGNDVRYERERVLGEGGMGIVELHKDQRIGRSVAMKILRTEVADSMSQRRFLHEAQLQGQLEHPAIVPVYDLGEAKDGAAYFTMKRIRGVTLHDVIVGLRREDEAFTAKYSRRKLLSAFSQVCLAIDFAHTRGVLHRDLKPANIMLGDFGEVYVLDWGIAKIAGAVDEAVTDAVKTPLPAPATQVGSMLGTPGYMSPEQLRGNDIARTADVYSLGAILFELLALEPLHKRGTRLDVIITATITGGEHRPSARSPQLDIPPELDDIAIKALALEPEDRYPEARELHDAIESYLDGERDLEVRRERSRDHTAKASEAIHDVEHGSPDVEIAARRRAMVEIGKAVAQDPENADALAALEKLLKISSRVPLPEVTAAIQHGEHVRLKQIALLGGLAYFGVWLFLPLVLWMGVREPWPVVGLFAGATLAGTASVIIGRMKEPHPNLVVIPLITSNLAFGCISGILGPLVFVPTVAVVNTVAFMIHANRSLRAIIFLTGISSFAVPLVLELAGVIPRSYSFGPEGMTVLPRGLDLNEIPTLTVLVVAQAFAVGIGIFVVGIIRDSIDRAEKSTYTYAWHLREWIPDSHKRRTDPVNRRATKPIAAAKPR